MEIDDVIATAESRKSKQKTKMEEESKIWRFDLKNLFALFLVEFSDREEDNDSPDFMVLERDSESEEGELEDLFPVPNLQGKRIATLPKIHNF